ARIHADRMDTGQVRAAPHPLLALGVIPERADHVPALPAIARAEEPARQRSAPNDAGLVPATRLERPNACRAPIDRPAPHTVPFVALRFARREWPAGGGGQAGAALSSHPFAGERWSLPPKWRWASAA